MGHGLSTSREYAAWQNAKDRCLNSNNHAYEMYGGRGIKICRRWMKFENFYKDMGPRPSSKHTLDRKDNDGNYEPGNCRWATRRQQANNMRTNTIVKYKGKEMTLARAARKQGITYKAALHRMKRYGSITFIPVNRRGRLRSELM